MNNSGVRTTSLSNRVPLADEVLVNREKSTGLQPFSDFATQLAGSGAVADALAEVRAQAAKQKLSRPTVQSLAAELARPDETTIEVYGDTEANNGVYRKVGAPGQGSYVKDGPLPQANVSDLTARADQKLLPARELVVEGTKLLIPAMYYWLKGANQYAAPSDGSQFWEVDIQADPANVRWHYFSKAIAASGNNPIVTVEVGNNPQVSTAGLVLIAYSLNGQVTTDLPIIGGRAGGVVANQWLEGKYPEAIEWFYGSATHKAASAPMAALGFAKVCNAATAAELFVGRALEDRTVGGEAVFARLWLYQPTPVAADVKLNLFSADLYLWNMTFKKEKQVNANVSIWVLRDRVPAGMVADRFNVGVDQGSARNWEIAVPQFAIGRGDIGWISRDDFPPQSPVSYRPLLGPDLWMLSGRDFPLYLENVIGVRSDGLALVKGGFWSVNPDAQGDTHSVQGTGQFIVDPDKCGPTGVFEIRVLRGRKDIHYAVPTRNRIAKPLSVTKTVNVLQVGDSMPNRGFLADLDRVVRAYNVNVNWLGTIRTALDDVDPYNDERGPLGECREGFEAGDYTGQVTDKAAAVTNWSAYMAADKVGKIGQMPFLRDAVAGDPADRVFNGKTHGIRDYLTSTAQPDPHIILSDLITNDQARQTPDVAAAHVANYIRIAFSDMRAALPNVRLGWWSPPWSQSNLGYQFGDHYRIMQAAVEQIRSFDDPHMYELPVWASVSTEIGYKLDQSAFPDVNYAIRARIADPTHWVNGLSPLRQQAVKVVASFIINMAMEL